MEKKHISNYRLFCFVILITGTFINILAYSSIEPLLIVVFFLFVGYTILFCFFKLKQDEYYAYTLSFTICWFWAGIAAYYANFLNDPGQNILDAGEFYRQVSGDSFSRINVFGNGDKIENAGAILIWQKIYDFFDFLGFSKERYIGILVNTSFVAFTSVIGLQLVKRTFNNDKYRINKFIIIYTLCPVFWYFAAVHIRDAVILFAVSLLVLIWVIYIEKSTFKNLIKVISLTIISFFVLGSLRTEFAFVPLAIIFTGITAIIFGKSVNNKLGLIIFALISLVAVGYVFYSMQSEIVEIVEVGNESYNTLSLDESGASSLGNALIVSSSIPIRLLLGSIYLFIFPIPFWIGFQLVSVSPLFKSLHVIFMYGITPLFIFSFLEIIRFKQMRKATSLFLLFLSIGFTFGVAFTSLETRHFAAFLVPILVFSLNPDLTQKIKRNAYLKILKKFIGVMFLVHVTWIILKSF